MFLDYSGLQRFSEINLNFAEKYLQLLYFETLEGVDARLNFIKKITMVSNVNKDINSLVVDDFILEHPKYLEDLLLVILCIQQSETVHRFVERCPTVYMMEVPILSQDMLDKDHLAIQIYEDIYLKYKKYRNFLLQSLKQCIVDIQPDFSETTFKDWNQIQKYLFHELCDELTDFVRPKTNIVIIPISFPKAYSYLTDSYGFIKINSKLMVSKFLINVKKDMLIQSITQENLTLTPYEQKISTIWRAASEKEFIGTASKSPLKNNNDTTLGTIYYSPSPKNPKFLDIFKECHINIENEMKDIPKLGKPRRQRILQKNNRTNINMQKNIDSTNESIKFFTSSPQSTNRSNNNIFSAVNSTNVLPTAATQPTTSTPSFKNNAMYKIPLFSHENVAIIGIEGKQASAPPTILHFFDQDDSSINVNSKSQKLKSNFKKLRGKTPANKTKSSKSKGKQNMSDTIDTIRTVDEIEYSPNIDISFKTFVRYKLIKVKNNYHYCKDVAKYCFEEYYENKHQGPPSK